MRKIRKKREKQKKKIIIISVFLFLIIMTSGYAAFSTNITFHAKGNIIEGPRVIQAWDQNSQTDFHSDYYKENIVSVTFLDNNNVPDSAVESWNVSEDKENGEVMAWVVPSAQDISKYDLYIGAKNGVIANENSSFIFRYFTEIISVNFNNNFDTSDVTNMRSMFSECHNLAHLNLNGINTSQTTDMSYMFYHNYNLLEVDLSNFNTSNVTNMEYMFYSCRKLITIDLTSFDTSNVVSMKAMFSMWDESTSSAGETLLDSILFGEKFNTQKVTNMESMFYGCYELSSLNLCSFNTTNTTNMTNMFRGTSNLKNIYVSANWNTSNADTIDMFYSSGVSSVTTGQC